LVTRLLSLASQVGATRTSRTVKATLLLAMLQGVLAVGLSWLSDEWLALKIGAPDPHASATVVERLAEQYATAAGRSVITADRTALADLVKRAATWPEIMYVGVEDAQGRVLAHTDPARVGKIWSEAISTGIRATAGAAHREVVVPVMDPGQRDGPPVGWIRLGYVTIEPIATGRTSVVPFLVLAMVAVVPLGGLLIAFTRPPTRRPDEPHTQPLEHLVAWADRERFVTEVQRLKGALDERDAEVARLTKAVTPTAIASTPPANTSDPSHQRAIISITQAVRTSLTNILGFSKLLLRELDGPLTEAQTADVLNIQRAGTELRTFVTALSELNRTEASQVKLQPEAVDAKALLHELAAECGLAHSLDMKVECPAELPIVRADRTHLVEILHTLITQATALSGHGEVVLRPQAHGMMVLIAVAHPGRVISDEDMVTMFDPFASKETNGVRIGLALARSLAILNGGDIAVENQPGNGVVFTLTVPMEVAHAG
jgi:signal transduction histidine kinase